MRTRLTTDAQVQISPVWSPDGSEFLFVGGSAPSRMPISPHDAFPRSAGERDGSRGARRSGSKPPTGRATAVTPCSTAETSWPPTSGPSPGRAGQGLPAGPVAESRRRRPVSRRTAAGCPTVSCSPRGSRSTSPRFPAAGARWQVSASGGTDARWAPDGKTIYFLSLDNQVMAAPVDGSGAEFRRREGRAALPDQRLRRSSHLERLRGRAGRQALPRQQRRRRRGAARRPVSNWTSALPK